MIENSERQLTAATALRTQIEKVSHLVTFKKPCINARNYSLYRNGNSANFFAHAVIKTSCLPLLSMEYLLVIIFFYTCHLMPQVE